MPLLTKICGITCLEDARYCAGAGADYLGFIQYPPSPRYVEAKYVAEITRWIYGPVCVGVFVNEDADTIDKIAECAGFQQVQLHGEEPPALCARIERPVLKALRIEPDCTADKLSSQMEQYLPHVDCFLLDTYDEKLRGGTGKTFDWSVARTVAANFPVLLSGGIGAHNIQDAVQQALPLGVDLSSKLESAPGKKDFQKVNAFFETVDTLP